MWVVFVFQDVCYQVIFYHYLDIDLDIYSDEKKMVENSTLGIAYSSHTIYTANDIALCTSCTKFYT